MSEFVMKPSIFDQKSTVVLNTSFNVNYEKYMEVKKYEDGRKITIQPKGDVDTINILANPEAYGMNMKEAFAILERDGKKIGISILCCSDEKNIIEEIKNSLKNFY